MADAVLCDEKTAPDCSNAVAGRVKFRTFTVADHLVAQICPSLCAGRLEMPLEVP
jgi:hypothetical protein